MAKLTAPVNIAVFAAFAFCIRGDLLSNAAFKPVCRLRERDIARYGWQKRQDLATKWQWMARWMAKTATLGGIRQGERRHPRHQVKVTDRQWARVGRWLGVWSW